jgi:NTP pyrophosphatase (non-canonical NTP hydrolase)
MKNDLQKILKFRDDRDWKQFQTPKNLAISLSIEANEVLEIFQWAEGSAVPVDEKEHLAEEIADVYAYLLLLANETGIDLSEAFEKKMQKNAEKYPVEKSKGNATKYTKL